MAGQTCPDAGQSIGEPHEKTVSDNGESWAGAGLETDGEKGGQANGLTDSLSAHSHCCQGSPRRLVMIPQ